MKKVLIIAYYYPPMGGSGVLRTVKFARYLPLFGWKPVILTVKEGNVECQDESLFKEISSDTEVYRTRSIEPRKIGFVQRSIEARRNYTNSWFEKLKIKILNAIRNLILVPDEQIGWLPFAVRQGFILARRSDIDVIFSTSMPYTSHLIGFLLKKLCGKQWVVDLRDPWTQNPIEKIPQRSFLFEKMILMHADKIIPNTPNFKKVLLRQYPRLYKQNVVPITNGYDEMDFIDLTCRQKSNGRFVITFLGTFYNNLHNPGRYGLTPEYFLRGFKLFIDKNALTPKDVEARFFGLFGKMNEPLVAELGLTSFVKIHGYVPHHEALMRQMDSDVLLLIMYDDEKNKATVPQKTYEYFASGKPILALVGDDGVAELIRMIKVGLVVNPLDPVAIQKGIETFYKKYKKGNLNSRINKDFIHQFEWKNLTKQLVKVFNG